jgi:hypothetical protein
MVGYPESLVKICRIPGYQPSPLEVANTRARNASGGPAADNGTADRLAIGAMKKKPAANICGSFSAGGDISG